MSNRYGLDRARCLWGAAALITSSAWAAPAMASAGSPKVEFLDGPAATLQKIPHSFSAWGMFQAADGVVKAVIVMLVIASLVSWTIGLSKYLELAGERRRLATGMGSLSRAASLAGVEAGRSRVVSDLVMNAEDEIAASESLSGPRASDAATAASLLSAHLEAQGVKERVGVRLERVEAGTGRRLGRSVGILAIIGSTAPFVGLFGTVWGVMNSFIGIAEAKTTNLAVVAPGIAEALLATAFGLVAAIPAVVLYNLFARMISAHRGALGDASATVLCLASREIDHAALTEGAH